MKVVIIGSGNVATVLGKKIFNSGHEIIQVAGRNVEQTAVLASSLKTTYTTNLLKISILADIYIICVSDVTIGAVAGQLKLNDRLVVHTAASVSKEVLIECSAKYGVLYPLQTLKKEVKSIPEIPILVDGNNDQTIEELIGFSTSWADTVAVANDEERLKLHLSAVFANNFTNHLLAISEEYCSSNKLNFRLLQPILEETILRLKENQAANVQTGPAIRRDFSTIAKHQEMLENDPDFLNVYNTLTNSIIEFYNKH